MYCTLWKFRSNLFRKTECGEVLNLFIYFRNLKYVPKPIYSNLISKAGMINYFKAGCYTQSNITKGDGKGQYAQTQISKLAVMHK